MQGKLRCLIVEDHSQARLWLRKALEQAFDAPEITLATSIAEGETAIGHSVPNLALIDLGLPDGNGISLIRKLDELRRHQQLPLTIVVSTVMNDDESIFAALRAGSDGYILKEETLSNLVEMLRGILQQRPPLSPSIAMRLLRHFRSEPEDNLLSPRENQVLQLLAKGYTVPRVSDLLGIKPSTASGYVKDIYRKLNVNSRAEATLEASKRGLV